MKNNKNWKRFSIIDKGFALLFILSIILNSFCTELIESDLANTIFSYMFWLSMGLFIGFQLCKHEYRRVTHD